MAGAHLTGTILFREKTGQVACGASTGRRDDLVGGGLIRSSGRWTNVLAMRRDNLFRKSDERILGDGDFVDRVPSDAQERMARRYHLEAMGFGIENIANHVCRLLAIGRAELFTSGKEPTKVIGACDPAGDNNRASHQNHAAWTKDDGCWQERHRIVITLRRGFVYAVRQPPDTKRRAYLMKTHGRGAHTERRETTRGRYH